MAKELPYFKYFPSEWVTGDITLCSMETQGLFVNLCCYYWMKNCSMSLANAKQRFSKYEASLNELLKIGILKIDENENVVINFLDKQMNEFVNVSEKRSLSGALGGLAKAKHLPKIAIAKPSNKDKEKEKDINKVFYEKELNFKKEIETYQNTYSIEMLKAFFIYWSEPNKTKSKMRFEMEKTWDTKRRLITWFERNKNK